MNFRFNITSKQLAVGEGEIVSYSLLSEKETVSTLSITIEADEIKIVDFDQDETKVIELPRAGVFARIFGVNKYTMLSDLNGITLDIEMYVVGLYPTYEEACAAEMKNKMENAR